MLNSEIIRHAVHNETLITANHDALERQKRATL